MLSHHASQKGYCVQPLDGALFAPRWICPCKSQHLDFDATVEGKQHTARGTLHYLVTTVGI